VSSKSRCYGHDSTTRPECTGVSSQYHCIIEFSCCCIWYLLNEHMIWLLLILIRAWFDLIEIRTCLELQAKHTQTTDRRHTCRTDHSCSGSLVHLVVDDLTTMLILLFCGTPRKNSPNERQGICVTLIFTLILCFVVCWLLSASEPDLSYLGSSCRPPCDQRGPMRSMLTSVVGNIKAV